MKTAFYAFFVVSVCSFVDVLAQERVDITTCDATSAGVICISPTDSLYEICVKLKPGPCTSKVYEVEWDDGKKEDVTLAGEVTLKHTYDLKTFVKNCSSGSVRFDIFIQSKACPNDNKGFRVTFNKKPQARPAAGFACEGSAVRFTNNSCPTSSDITFSWDLGNGQTSTEISPSVTYVNPSQTYKVKLTATSMNCGTSSAEVDVKLKKLPEAKYATSGYSVVNTDTVTCLSNGGTLTMDGTLSIDATRYQWSISPGDYKFINGTNANSPKPVIQFTKSGTYNITLIAENECGQSKPNICPHKVIDAPTVTLPRQADVCQAPFNYKFTPQAGVTYKINGKAFDPAAGEELMFQSTSYIVEATIANPCGGTITDRDTFLVAALTQVKITSPLKDTTLCVGSASIALTANVPNGVWSGSTLIEPDGVRKVFNPTTLGVYIVRYVVGSGVCTARDSARVNVEGIKPTVMDITACQGVTFLKLQATPAGGRWSGCTGCLKGDTLIVSALTGNQLKLTYELVSAKGCRASAEATVTIGRPKADFTLAGGCVGGAMVPVNISSGVSNYKWFVNGIDAGSVAAPALTLQQGLNNVTLIAGSGACVDTLTKEVLVTAPPAAANFTLSQTEGCAPLNTSFVPGGTSSSSTEYSWTFGDGTQYEGFQPPPKIFDNRERTEKTFTVTFTAKNTCGEQKSTQNISVRPLAQAEIGVDSTTVRCTPAMIIFSNRSTGHDKPQTRWFFGDGSSRQTGADTVWHPFSARDSARTYRVRLQVISTCGMDSASVDIKVFPTLVKPLFTLSKSEVCPGEPIQFTDATVPKPNRWVWKFGDGSIDTRANPSHAFTQPNRDYLVTLIAYTTCGYDSTDRLVKVTQLPTGDFRLEAPVACQNQPVQFLNGSDPQLGFVWDFGDGSPLDSVNYSPIHTYAAMNSNLSATLVVYRGSMACKSQPIRKSVPVAARSVADFSIEGDSLICAPGPVRLVNRSQNADKYQWYFSDGRTSDAQNPILAFSKGAYDVKLVVSNRGVCKDSTFRLAAFLVDSCTVIAPQAFSPNGDGIGDFYTLFGSGIKEIVWLRIRDRWGEVIFNAKNIPPGKQNEEQAWDGRFERRDMPADMYVVEAEVVYIETPKKELLRKNLYLVR